MILLSQRFSFGIAMVLALAAPAVLLGLSAPESTPSTAAAIRPLRIAAAPRDQADGAMVFATGQDAPPSPAIAPDLVGIAGRLPHDAVALVRTDGALRTLSVGGAAGGWTLKALAPDAALFSRDGVTRRVDLPTHEETGIPPA